MQRGFFELRVFLNNRRLHGIHFTTYILAGSDVRIKWTHVGPFRLQLVCIIIHELTSSFQNTATNCVYVVPRVPSILQL